MIAGELHRPLEQRVAPRAAGRSRGSAAGTPAGRARTAASAMPNRMPSSASSGIDAVSVRTSAAIAPTSTPRARCAASIIVAGRPAVGEDAERQEEDRARDADRDQDRAQREAGPGQVEDEPGRARRSGTSRRRARRPRSPRAGGSRGRRAIATWAGCGRGEADATNPWAAGGSLEDDPDAARRRRRRRGPGPRKPESSPRGRGSTWSPDRPGTRSRANLPTAIGSRRLTTLPAVVTDLDAGASERCAGQTLPGAARAAGRKPAARRPATAAVPPPARSTRPAPRRGRRGSGRPPRRSAGPRPRAAGPRRADRRPSAPPPEAARAGFVERLEPVRGGLDVEVAALERAEDVEAGGLAAVDRAVGARTRPRRPASSAGGRRCREAASASATTARPSGRRGPGRRPGTGAAGVGRDGARRVRRAAGTRGLRTSGAGCRRRRSRRPAGGCRPTSSGTDAHRPVADESVRRPRPPSARWRPGGADVARDRLRLEPDGARGLQDRRRR